MENLTIGARKPLVGQQLKMDELPVEMQCFSNVRAILPGVGEVDCQKLGEAFLVDMAELLQSELTPFVEIPDGRGEGSTTYIQIYTVNYRMDARLSKKFTVFHNLNFNSAEYNGAMFNLSSFKIFEVTYFEQERRYVVDFGGCRVGVVAPFPKR